MKILGIDPGTARVGWGLVEKSLPTRVGRDWNAVSYGLIEPEHHSSLAYQLRDLYRKMMDLVSRLQPDALSVEELFFSTNVKTAMAVGHARGVILLAAAEHNLPVTSYSPNTIKLAICGTGSAEKTQMQRMVTRLLRLSAVPSPDDVADALAIALTHAYSYKSTTHTL